MATAELSAEHREIRMSSRCVSSPPISLNAFLLRTLTWKSGPSRAALRVNKDGLQALVVVLGARTPSTGAEAHIQCRLTLR